GLRELAGRDADEVGAEVGGDNDRGVDVAALYRVLRLALVHEDPAELVVLFELRDDLLADVERAGEVRIGALVEIDDRNSYARGVRVRIPERVDVEPRVQRRRDKHTDDDDPHPALTDESHRVAPQDLQTLSHANEHTHKVHIDV